MAHASRVEELSVGDVETNQTERNQDDSDCLQNGMIDHDD
jgi:hypothetical protein